MRVRLLEGRNVLSPCRLVLLRGVGAAPAIDGLARIYYVIWAFSGEEAGRGETPGGRPWQQQPWSQPTTSKRLYVNPLKALPIPDPDICALGTS